MSITEKAAVDSSRDSRRRSSWSEFSKDLSWITARQVNEEYMTRVEALNTYYHIVKSRIMNYQSMFGLYPSFHVKGSPNVSLLKDSLYCAACVWALRQCYQGIDDDRGRSYELGQCVVKTMRAILFCWMQQSSSVENFKANQREKYALHSMFSLDGREAFSNEEYGHLQLGTISFYLISMAQMIASGLQIIYSADEISFIQQLIFYVERAYRTPDFGYWGRGSKYNVHTPELHASAIGASKAALEIMNGFNLYGREAQSSKSVVYVDIDAYNRNRIILNTMLPRESASKNVDAALLFTIGWPAFAVKRKDTIAKTIAKCKRKLEGPYGFKRYLRDGRHTVVEDSTREYYTIEEMKSFDGIECQWPMFFAQMVIHAIFEEDKEMEETYMKKLESLIRKNENDYYMPMCYTIPSESLDAARKGKLDSVMQPSNEFNEGYPYLLSQSLWIIALLLNKRLLTTNLFDPLRRHLNPNERPVQYSRYSLIKGLLPDLVIHVVPISESTRLQRLLLTYGIVTQTPKQIEPIKICSPNEIIRAYNYLGVNEKLNFSGRPARPIGVLGTCKVYWICSQMVVGYPLTFETVEFYVSHDLSLLLDNIREDFEFISKCWKLQGKPVYCFLIREAHLKGVNRHELLKLLTEIKAGMVNDVRVCFDRIQTVVPSAAIEHLDFMDNLDISFAFDALRDLESSQFYFKSLTDISYRAGSKPVEWGHITFEDFSRMNPDQLESTLHQTYINDGNSEQSSSYSWQFIQILAEMTRRYGLDHYMSLGPSHSSMQLKHHIEKVLENAVEEKNWMYMRYCSAMLRLFVNSLAPSITNFIVRGKLLSIYTSSGEEVVLFEPLQPNEIFDIIYNRCAQSDLFFSVIVQEMILVLSNFMSSDPSIFNGILKLRLNWIFKAMKIEMENFTKEIQEPVSIYSLSPNELKQLVYFVFSCENDDPDRTFFMNKRLDGALGRYPDILYSQAWYILGRVEGFKIAGGELMQHPTMENMTDYELEFSLVVEGMLSAIEDPLYRQTVVDTIQVLYAILSEHRDIVINEVVNIDEIISAAVDRYLAEFPTSQAPKRDSFFELDFRLTKGGSANYLARTAVDILLSKFVSSISTERNSEDTCKPSD